jgi:AGCS family alanine or glycine:cation symporter
MLAQITALVDGLLVYPIFGYVPFIIAWLGAIGIFLTIRLKFINITLLPSAVKLIMKGKRSDEKDTVSPFGALMSTVASTVGMGSLAGTAFALTVAGPGAIFWMVFFSVLGMTVKASEVYLGHKYRRVGADGKISGGGFYYLAQGLKELGLPKLGIVCAFLFALFGYLAVWGMAGFQMNQIVSLATGQTADVLNQMMEGNFSFKVVLGFSISLAIACFIVYVLVGGIKRVANFATAIVPTMFTIYLIGAIVVLIVNSSAVIPAIKLIFAEAFNFSAGLTGFLVVIVTGARRGLYASEAGQGTSPVIASNSNMQRPEEQAIVTLLDPLIVGGIMFLNGLCIVATQTYLLTGLSGILITQAAFATVAPWFGYVATICAIMFAFTTVMTDAYYYEKFGCYIMPKINKTLLQVSYGVIIFVFGISKAADIISFMDLFVLLMAIPNILGLYLLSNKIANDFEIYKESIKKRLEK